MSRCPYRLPSRTTTTRDHSVPGARLILTMNLDGLERHTEGPWELILNHHGYRPGMEKRPEPDYNSTDVSKHIETMCLTTSFSDGWTLCGYAWSNHIRFPEPRTNGSDWKEISTATARLIAAAPLLLTEVKRLRDLVDFAIAMIDSNDCAMGEEEQADLERHLRSSRDSERTDWTEED